MATRARRVGYGGKEEVGPPGLPVTPTALDMARSEASLRPEELMNSNLPWGNGGHCENANT
jgi:hypothetical protein